MLRRNLVALDGVRECWEELAWWITGEGLFQIRAKSLQTCGSIRFGPVVVDDIVRDSRERIERIHAAAPRFGKEPESAAKIGFGAEDDAAAVGTAGGEFDFIPHCEFPFVRSHSRLSWSERRLY